MIAHKREPHIPGMEADEWRNWGEGIARGCSYCGSIHPADLAFAIKGEGAVLEEADRKYGWPHKWYLHGGTLKAHGARKFYSIHLQDAEPADRAVIEKAMGLHFEFSDDNGGSVRWSPRV